MIINPLEQLVTVLTFTKCHICQIREGPICSLCVDALSADTESRCYICNKLTKQSRVCGSHASALRRVWWLSAYSDVLKGLVTAMKLGRGRAIGRSLGNVCAEALPYVPSDTLVVAVPTAPRRVRRRGFDQSRLIAQALAIEKGLSVHTALSRRSNVDQIGKSRTERIKQMKHVFSVCGSVEGKTVLLVDDIITTGATIESAARCLRDAGAAHVDAVTVARHLLK